MFDVMIRFEVQLLVGVGWFSVHGDMSTAIVIDVYTGVQEGHLCTHCLYKQIKTLER